MFIRRCGALTLRLRQEEKLDPSWEVSADGFSQLKNKLKLDADTDSSWLPKTNEWIFLYLAEHHHELGSDPPRHTVLRRCLRFVWQFQECCFTVTFSKHLLSAGSGVGTVEADLFSALRSTVWEKDVQNGQYLTMWLPRHGKL